MSHINNSFKEKEIHEVDGIIGGDILVEFNAIINYKKRNNIKSLMLFYIIIH